jgi:hypothetical protein
MTENRQEENQQQEPATAGGPPVQWQFVVAVALLVSFVVLTAFMLSWADSEDGVWKNRVFVFSSVEAIVFTAVGWIFGREVHRSQVESARDDAEQAKADAKEKAAQAADEQAKGKQLAGAVEVMAAAPDVAGRGRDVGLGETPDLQSSQLAAVRDLARRLYG